MIKKIGAALAALMLVFVMGCSTGAPETPQEEPKTSSSQTLGPQPYSYFLDTVRTRLPQLYGVPDKDIITTAENACAALESLSPLTTQEFVVAVRAFADGTNGRFTNRESAWFIGASTAGFCPDMTEEIAGLTSGGSV